MIRTYFDPPLDELPLFEDFEPLVDQVVSVVGEGTSLILELLISEIVLDNATVDKAEILDQLLTKTLDQSQYEMRINSGLMPADWFVESTSGATTLVIDGDPVRDAFWYRSWYRGNRWGYDTVFIRRGGGGGPWRARDARPGRRSYTAVRRRKGRKVRGKISRYYLSKTDELVDLYDEVEFDLDETVAEAFEDIMDEFLEDE